MILLFKLILFFHLQSNAIMTHELIFDHKTYKMVPFNISKQIFSSQVLAFGLNAVWTRIESLDEFDLKKKCDKQAELLTLKLKLKDTTACLNKDNSISFVSQAYQKIPYYNIHHFKFPQSTTKEKIINFFSAVTYQQKVN